MANLTCVHFTYH